MDARFPDGSRELVEGIELPEALAYAEAALERGAEEVTLFRVDERRKSLEARIAALEEQARGAGTGETDG